MKIGDLVKVSNNTCEGGHGCGCWFCYNESSALGIVVEHLNEKGVRHSGGYWAVMFKAGEWRLYGTEIEVISENR